ncbi:MAG: C40 family peptidase [Thermaceae bacterium]
MARGFGRRVAWGVVLLLGLGLAQTHTVLPGDTLYSIARKYGTTVEELQRLNGLDGFLLQVGQVLHIPVKGGSPGTPAPPKEHGEEGPEADELPWETPFLRVVLKYLGTPYKHDGNSPLALDCSAFVAQVYRELGYALPRTSKEQYAALSPVDKPLPGDLVFFSFSGRQIDHVGLYLGRGVFAHASSYGSRVVIESLEAPVYQKAYRGARRLPGFSVWGAPYEATKDQETPPR